MSMMRVPSLSPGERTLPAELRTARGVGFAQRRMANQLSGVAGFGRGIRGLGSPGDCIAYADDGSCSEYDQTFDTGEYGTGSTLIPACMPASGIGPLAPGQEYCDVTTADIQTMIDRSAGGTLTPTQSAEVAAAAKQVARAPSNYAGPKVVAAGQTPPTPPAGYAWGQLLGASGQTLAQVLAVAQGGSSVTLPNGAHMIYGSAQSSAAGSGGLVSTNNLFGSISPNTVMLLGIGVVAFMMIQGGKR